MVGKNLNQKASATQSVGTPYFFAQINLKYFLRIPEIFQDIHYPPHGNHYKDADDSPDYMLFACGSRLLIIRRADKFHHAVNKKNDGDGKHKGNKRIYNLLGNFF